MARPWDRSGRIRDIIDGEKFRPIISEMYRDYKETGSRSHNNEILMNKMLVLAGWHGVSEYIRKDAFAIVKTAKKGALLKPSEKGGSGGCSPWDASPFWGERGSPSPMKTCK